MSEEENTAEATATFDAKITKIGDEEVIVMEGPSEPGGGSSNRREIA